VPNGPLPRTDARLEQGSEVVGSRLTRGVPSDLAQTRTRRCLRTCTSPTGGFRPLALDRCHFGGLARGMKPRYDGGVAPTTASEVFGERRVMRSVATRGKGGPRARSRETRAGRNGKRATGAERRHGWSSGKSSEDPNPMGGGGAKQSHQARVG
jgi:hypothetical protein